MLDGSVREAGNRLRVAARLIRADNGYVIWSETYDRPLGDILMVQDEHRRRSNQSPKGKHRSQTGPLVKNSPAPEWFWFELSLAIEVEVVVQRSHPA